MRRRWWPLPSPGSSPSWTCLRADEERNAVDPNAIGREPKAAVNEVEKGAIRRFAESLGEPNPIYFEHAPARPAGYPSLAPPPPSPPPLPAGSDLLDGR